MMVYLSRPPHDSADAAINREAPMNRNAISRLVEVSLLAGIALSLAGAGSVLAQEKVATAKPAVAAPNAAPPTRQSIATQKRMRNPWEKTTEVATTQLVRDAERLNFYW